MRKLTFCTLLMLASVSLWADVSGTFSVDGQSAAIECTIYGGSIEISAMGVTADLGGGDLAFQELNSVSNPAAWYTVENGDLSVPANKKFACVHGQNYRLDLSNSTTPDLPYRLHLVPN